MVLEAMKSQEIVQAESVDTAQCSTEMVYGWTEYGTDSRELKNCDGPRRLKLRTTGELKVFMLPHSTILPPKGKVKVTQSCTTLCDFMDYTVHGILQARVLEWVAFPFSRGSSQPRDRTQVSHVARWILYQLSHRKAEEYWSGEPIPSPVDLPNPGTEQGLLHCKRILYQLGYQGSPTSLQKQSHVRKLQALGSDYWLLKKLKRGYTSKLPLPLENLGMNQKRNIRIRHIKVFVQVHSFFKFLYSART